MHNGFSLNKIHTLAVLYLASPWHAYGKYLSQRQQSFKYALFCIHVISTLSMEFTLHSLAVAGL